MRAARDILTGLLLVSLCTTAALAQDPRGAGTVRGHVVDARTGAGLPRVLVLIEDDGPSTLTADDGRFELTPVKAGDQRLYVSVVGYILVRRDVTIADGGTLDLTIPLAEGTGTYSESVTVAADRFR